MEFFLILAFLCLLLTLSGRISAMGGLAVSSLFVIVAWSNPFSPQKIPQNVTAFPIEKTVDILEVEEEKPLKKPFKRKAVASFNLNVVLENDLLEKLESAINMQFRKDGVTQIGIQQTGFFQENPNDSKRVKYSGGQLEVLVNGRKCCCQPNIKIKGTRFPGLQKPQAEQKLEEQLSDLFSEHLETILPQIKKCL